MASFSEWFAAQSAVRASVGSPTGAMAAPAPPASSSLSSFFSSASVNPDPEIPTAVVADPPPSLNMNSVISLLPAIMRVGPLAAALGGGAAPTSDVPEWTCGMNAGQRFQAFGILLVTSLVLYIVSIFVFLPMVIFMPSKFAITFTFASIAWMAAFAILRGPRHTLIGLVSDKDKRVFTLAYISSLLMTLYFTIIISSYLLALVAIAAQVSAMAWYMSSSIPGGTAAMSTISRWCCGSLTSYLPLSVR